MPTLWHRFAEDTALPSTLDEREQKTLSTIFDAANPQSLWCRALRDIGLQLINPPEGLLRWHHDTPYVNWHAMVHVVSGGSLIPQPEGAQFTYRYRYTLSTVWGMVKAQWRITKYAQNSINATLPDDSTDQLVESLALGFCIFALTMRIPAATLQDGLTGNMPISKTFCNAIVQIKALQHRRNQLSPAWASLFPTKEYAEIPNDKPEFFWDAPPENTAAYCLSHQDTQTPQTELPARWQGIPIAGDVVTARAFLVRSKADVEQVHASTQQWALIFPMARPETTELFASAAAVLYAQGGALSHAASIAREQNLPSMTGLGKKFIEDIAQHLAINPNLLLRIEPLQRSVAVME